MVLPRNIMNKIVNKSKSKNVYKALRVKNAVSKASQRRVAKLALGNKKLKGNLSARNIQKMGYPENVFPVHMLNGKFTEGNNVALYNAAMRKVNNANIATNNYYSLINRMTSNRFPTHNNVNKYLRRTAPRGLRYSRLAGGENVYKNRINKLHRYQVGVPGRVQKALNRLTR